MFGTPSESEAFQDIIHEVTKHEHNEYGITNSAYQHHVDAEFERNHADKTRSDYYRSREFAHLCRKYDLGEANFFGKSLSEMYEQGCFLVLPRQAQLDHLVYRGHENVIPISSL